MRYIRTEKILDFLSEYFSAKFELTENGILTHPLAELRFRKEKPYPFSYFAGDFISSGEVKMLKDFFSQEAVEEKKFVRCFSTLAYAFTILRKEFSFPAFRVEVEKDFTWKLIRRGVVVEEGKGKSFEDALVRAVGSGIGEKVSYEDGKLFWKDLEMRLSSKVFVYRKNKKLIEFQAEKVPFLGVKEITPYVLLKTTSFLFKVIQRSKAILFITERLKNLTQEELLSSSSSSLHKPSQGFSPLRQSRRGKEVGGASFQEILSLFRPK